MIMDAVEVFVIDDDGKIAELRAYWDMSRRTHARLARIVAISDRRTTARSLGSADSTFARTPLSATLL